MTWSVERRADGVTVTNPDENIDTLLGWRWLRDHGEDPASYNHETRQRRVDALGDAPAPADHASLTEVDGRPVLALGWPGGLEPTYITLDTIATVLADRPSALARPWRRGDEVELTVETVDAVLEDDAALTTWLADLATWGVARLRGFDGSRDRAQRLADRIGYVRTTIFGGLWDLASDVDTHDDTAYTQTFLAPHTDGTYSHDAPGLQMFCCTHRTGTGGESVIVDGMGIALDLEQQHPDCFDVLTSVPVPAHYVEAGVELRASRPALRVDPATGRLLQISLNNYDRSPMWLPPDEMAAFYEAYGALQRMADDHNRWLSIRLEAGDVLINDNWRVLHGRQAYAGERRFVGCYLNHEDFESRCRTLGIAR